MLRICSKCGTPQQSLLATDIFSCDACGSSQFSYLPQPAFILGVASVRLGETRHFTMTLQHKRTAFKPTRLYAHLSEEDSFILEKVSWGMRKESPIVGPIDLSHFSMSQKGLELDLPRLTNTERIVMSVCYTGHPIKGFKAGDWFSLPIVWAEPGAVLHQSENITLTYSVE